MRATLWNFPSGSVYLRATLRNMPSEWSTRTLGPDKAPLCGRGSGLSFRRFAQGWQLSITRLKADPTAGTDLGTASHGDRRLLLPFGRTLQVSGYSDPRGVPGRLGQCPQWRCQSNQARIGRRTMALTRRMVTLHPRWARLQLRRHQQGWAFGDFCSGSNLPRGSPDYWRRTPDATCSSGRLRTQAGSDPLAACY
jgi:hypothetical protein